MDATLFIRELYLLRKESNIPAVERIIRENDKNIRVIGVRSGELFKMAKKFISMDVNEIRLLLDSDYYEIRMGGICIMDFKARDKKTSDEERRILFNLYLEKHHRLTNWDYVDRAAPSVIGDYLVDKPRTLLYNLAGSVNPWERRTSIVSTWAFIRRGEVEDTFNIAEILVNDPHPNINRAVGSWIREAGKRNKIRLLEFLEKYKLIMPRVTLRYAIEKLTSAEKKYFMEKSK